MAFLQQATVFLATAVIVVPLFRPVATWCGSRVSGCRRNHRSVGYRIDRPGFSW